MVGPIPQALVSPDAKPSVNIPNLKRHLHGTEKEDNADNVVINIPSRIPVRLKLLPNSKIVTDITKTYLDAC